MSDPVYTTLASYLAALETHGATVDDIPGLINTLRRASAEIDRLSAVNAAMTARIRELEKYVGLQRDEASFITREEIPSIFTAEDGSQLWLDQAADRLLEKGVVLP